MRKLGKTYNEILKTIPVAKSTLSLWLRKVDLTKPQRQRITERRKAAQQRGGARRHKIRLDQTNSIIIECKKDVENLSNRDLFLLGIALYWAKGSKQKEYRPSVLTQFANSDPHMVKLFIKWLFEFGNVTADNLLVTVHLHKNHIERLEEITEYWSSITSLPRSQFTKPILKKHNPKSKRRNTGDTYKGLVSIRVRRSTELNQRINGWFML